MIGLSKWKRAVVHLECVTDSLSIEEQCQRFEELRQKLEKGEFSIEEYSKESEIVSRDIRYTGTAIFVKHNESKYLLTARHVLFDEKGVKNTLKDFKKGGAPDDFTESYSGEKIFGIIFRVPSLDEIYGGRSKKRPGFLMNLGVGPSDLCPYSFSDPQIDLAVISLRENYTFVEELESLGYTAVNLGDIADEPSCEGTEVFSVGYPQAIAVVGGQSLAPAEKYWTSSFVSLPTFSFGKVAMLHPQLHFYWCDMSICPGNSGGPVIENGKLVGIVSGQAVIASEIKTTEGETLPLISNSRVPYAFIIKAKYIRFLLEMQIKKDKDNAFSRFKT